MDKYLNQNQINLIATNYGYEYAALKAVIAKESSGHGFDTTTGKIIIQFEPLYFKRLSDKWANNIVGHVWYGNKVSNQTLEWLAFNDAYSIDAEAAMKSTSIGMMQVLGVHYAELGFKTIDEMWDYGKVSEYNQVDIGVKFIKSQIIIDKALKDKDWATFAMHYNGPKYKMNNYDTDLAKFYSHFSIDQNNIV